MTDHRDVNGESAVNVIRLHFQSSPLQRWRVRLKKLRVLADPASWIRVQVLKTREELNFRFHFVHICTKVCSSFSRWITLYTHKNTIVQTRKPQKVNVFVFSVGDRRVFLPVIRCLKMWHSLTCFIISCFYYSLFLKWRFEYQQTVFKHFICVHS